MLTGVTAYRWAAWAWMAIVVVVDRDELERPGIALVLVAAALAVTVADTLLLRTDADLLLRPVVVGTELAVAIALSVADPIAYVDGHSQSLGSAWPLAGILTAGIAFGAVGGVGAGVVVGLARLAGDLVATGPWTDARTLSALSTIVLYALAGGAAGFAAARLRRAEREIALARARAEVAATLHDGVLQTLAVVQRRTDDPDLARLAHEQERELRDFLAGRRATTDRLGPALRAAAARFEDRFGGRAEVVLADDLPEPDPEIVDALAGAVSEALTNAGRHGGAGRVTVYAEPGDGSGGTNGIFCSVNDDGTGFEPGETAEGTGITGSIRARVEAVGGRVEVDGRPGRGAEVRLWAPAAD
jgi:signal transduction histidine kinase